MVSRQAASGRCVVSQQLPDVEGQVYQTLSVPALVTQLSDHSPWMTV